MSEAQPYRKPEDEINLKEFILMLVEYSKAILAKWYWIVLVGLVFGAALGLNAWMTEINFQAETTFLVNEDEGKSLGSVGAVLGQFGLAGSNSEYNLDKVVELAKSGKIVQSALMRKVTIRQNEDLLANHLIRELGYHEEWADTDLSDFVFSQDSIEAFDRESKKVLKSLYDRVIRGGDSKPLMGISFDDATTILRLTTKTPIEELSLVLNDALYQELSKFYIDQSIGKPRQTYENLLLKSDSIRLELARAELSLARNRDKSLGIILAQDKVTRNRLEREVQLLTIMYGEVIKNTETASFALKNATPFFQLIDKPMSPLPGIGNSWFKSALLGFILGTFLTVSFLLLRLFYRNIMQSQELIHD